MKYGVILHKEASNLGDDIQTYAAAKLLPHVDYVIDREKIDTFQTEKGEPVGVIMSGWWFWQKWNWPPANCIVPLLTSMHMNNYSIYDRGTPVGDKWLGGLGGEYMKAYGPVGARDQSSLDFLREHDIPAFFSSCITTTIPKQKETANKGKYICLVDLNDKLKKKAYELLDGCGYEIIELSHDCRYRNSKKTLEERFAEVEKYLTLYQNAHCVITRRLHVTLPCLAMEVPVFSIVNFKADGNKTRWYPYRDWLHCTSNAKFLKGKFDYDFINPPENKPDYKQYREALITRVNDFIKVCEKNSDKSVEELKKTTYTQQEVLEWQNTLMKETLEEWMFESREMMFKYKECLDRLKYLEKEEGMSLGAIIKKRFKLWLQAFKKRIRNVVKKMCKK